LLYSPDGKHLFYEGRFPNHDNPLALYQWDIAAGREKRLLTVGLEAPAAVCSPDGKALFWLGETIRAWDIAKGQEQRSAEGADDYVLTADFTPDGKSLLVLRGDHSLRLWDIARRTYVPSFTARDVEFYRFSPDRRSLRTVGSDESLSERDLTSGRILRRYDGPPDSKRIWAPDGRVFATIDEHRRIHLWDALRGEETHRLEGHCGTVHSVTFSADGRWLFSAGEDATLQWWDVRTGRRIERFQDEATDHVCYALSQDGRLLAWACGERIHLWDLSARKEQRVFRGHAFGTNWVELEREGTVLVSTGRDDSTIRCWDTRTGQEFRAIRTGNRNPLFPLTRLFTSSDGRILAYGVKPRATGFVLLHPSTGIEICRTPKEVALEPSPDGKIVAVPGDKLSFHEVISGGVIAEAPLAHGAVVRWMRFSPDGKLLLTAGGDGVHLLWDWRRLTGLTREGAAEVGDREREIAWQNLASSDARKAYRAIGDLVASGDKVVTLLRECLRPAAAAERERWRKWIADLDNSDFAVREKAAKALMRLGVEAELFLRHAAADKVSLETRRRLEQILASDEIKRPSGDSLRKIRATQALEGIGTPAARELLVAWSRGDADAWLTREAQSALVRMRKRPDTP
jgi:WD40 repeat protein